MSSTKLTLAVPEAAASTDVIQFKLVLGGEVIYPAHFFTAKKKKTLIKPSFSLLEGTLRISGLS